jgi:signal transduction histidine kinase
MTEKPRSVAELLANLVQTRESQSVRVSKFLHDEVGQVLSAVGLQLDVLRLDFKDRVPEIIERTAEIQKILEQAVMQVRELSYELNPAIVERAGLPFALDRLAGRFRNEFGGTVRLLVDPGVLLPKDTATAFYKIAEQAIENAAVHSQATLIEILVRPTKSGPTLEVRDNGCGFDVEQIRKQSAGLGIILMDHYARQAGLGLSISSTSAKGTIVKVRLLVETQPDRKGSRAEPK